MHCGSVFDMWVVQLIIYPCENCLVLSAHILSEHRSLLFIRVMGK